MHVSKHACLKGVPMQSQETATKLLVCRDALNANRDGGGLEAVPVDLDIPSSHTFQRGPGRPGHLPRFVLHFILLCSSMYRTCQKGPHFASSHTVIS